MARMVLVVVLLLLFLPMSATGQESAPQVNEPSPVVEAEETVIVTATRTNTRLQDQPVRVEVIDREEIEEKALMTPGSVAMLLGETTGLRVQTTSPALGAANVRIQGLRGRYSQLVADGLPLYGAQGDSFSLLQVPPLDLAQVEIIKGAASALYGASALGGVINLVSRRPDTAERELLINGTSQSGQDVTSWFANPIGETASWTLLGGFHRQSSQDLDDDGWRDVPGFERFVLRPRVFTDNRAGKTMFATVGVMAEDREGGTAPGRTLPAAPKPSGEGGPGGIAFTESLRSRHIDAGFVGRWLAFEDRVISVRGSYMRRTQERRFGPTEEHGVRATWFGEVSFQGSSGRQTWVGGAAFQQDRHAMRELPEFDYVHSSPSLFMQDEISITDKWTLAVSARADVHSEYGVLATPRISLLSRPAAAWTIRVAAGTGAFAPTPFTEETEETGLSRLRPLRGLRAERARNTSLDVTRVFGSIEVTGTIFGSLVTRPIVTRTLDGGDVEFLNAPDSTRTGGTELLVRYRREGFVALATHAWTRSTEYGADERTRRAVPLTPSHAGSLNAIWEGDDWGRFGIEMYFIGTQELDENPYRRAGRPYLLLGALAERRLGRLRVFINAENLLDVRQTKFDPLTVPTPRRDGRWTVDAWAPLEGRVVNGGLRVAF
ncbi:MAG TPA: TonB-dependent receptor [Vicinamibacterales bacterium]|nr:TonB-dependent receptor [Vicinamibacterales bacterium]